MQYEKIFERLPGRYLILSSALEIVAVNDAYLEATMRTREQLLGRYVFDAFPENPDDPAGGVDKLRDSLGFVLATRQAHTMGLTRYDIPRQGGGFEERYWSPINTPVLDERGEVAVIIHRVEDVTEYVRLRERGHEMEHELFVRGQEIERLNRQLSEKNADLEIRHRERERLHERLREADRIKTTFFANVSHEFRTPLTLILGILQQWPDGEPITQERRAVLIRNAGRLLKLVNNMLDFARIEAGRMHVSFAPADLVELTQRAAAAFEPLVQQAGLEYEVTCDELSQPVYVDVESYEKIVLNLVSNAFKYTTAGKIAVRLQQHARGVRLVVEDTGVGMPQEELPRIFERFHRVRNSAGRSIEGTGIGLALTRELVEMHGGTIEARSELGRGSRFVVELPFGRAHHPPEQVSEAAALPSAPTPATDTWELYVDEATGWLGADATPVPAPPRRQRHLGPPARILVADDNPDMRQYIASLLQPLGEISSVPDGRAALEVARQEQPEVVVADLVMPEMSGLELVRALRGEERTAKTSIMLVSAHAGEDARLQGLRAGADDYMVKPFPARELVERVEMLAQRAREQRRLAEESRRKDEFLAILAHELRNPLAPLRTGIAVLEHDLHLSERSKRTLAIMNRQLVGLARLLDELLDVSRITRGRIELQKELVDLRQVARTAAESAQGLVEARQHELAISLPDAEAWSHVDPVRMEQVLTNLLTNAAKYTPPGGRIWLSVEPGDHDIEVRVRDTGIGLAPHELPSIFGLFEQVRSGRTRDQGGLGIGLTVVKQLVEMHGGTVEARSPGPGQGTELIVRVPRARPARAETPPDPAPPDLQGRGVTARVLVVDDNADAADLLVESIAALGGEVRAVYTGSEALSELSRWRPDVAILDIGLPDMDGYQLAREIRRRCDPPPRLIALSGYGQRDDRARSRAAGFDLHLLKPVAAEALLEAVAPRAAPHDVRASEVAVVGDRDR